MTESNNTNMIPHPRLRESLEKVRPEMAAIEQDDLLQILVDPIAAASTARGALPQILALRPRLVDLADFAIENLDKLELYALASTQAHSIFLGTSAPPERFQELVAEATTLREQLLSDATALANRNLINGARLADLKGSVGYKNVASDVITLANMIRAHWSAISTKTGVTLDELDRAEIIGDQLINDIGLREQAPAAIAAVALERQQAYTLLVNAYDEVRRAVTYLRWNEEDADEIAPSLFSGRRRKASAEVESKPEVAPVTTPSPVASAATVVAAAANATPAIGMPGADPFAH